MADDEEKRKTLTMIHKSNGFNTLVHVPWTECDSSTGPKAQNKAKFDTFINGDIRRLITANHKYPATIDEEGICCVTTTNTGASSVSTVSVLMAPLYRESTNQNNTPRILTVCFNKRSHKCDHTDWKWCAPSRGLSVYALYTFITRTN